MDRRDLITTFDDISQHLMLILADMEGMKKTIQQLTEENASLRLENNHLLDLLSQERAETKPSQPSKKGRMNLEKIYHEGFHICSDFYAQRREDGPCGFCMEFLHGGD